jgi:hypothetical protein
MMRFIAFALCFQALALCAQEPPEHVVVPGAYDLFTTDELGNIYALKGDELRLYNASGKLLLRNSLKNFGAITTIDAFSSLKPLIFSAPQGMLALLDNTLAIQGTPIDLNRAGFPQVTLACMSVQNALWFFDERLLQLTRVDAQLRPLATTGRLDQLLGFTPHPASMQEFDSWLYVCDPEEGVLVFDLFGGYAKTIPIMGARTFQVRDGFILYLKDGVLHSYNMMKQEIELPVTWLIANKEVHPVDARMDAGRLFVHYPERIESGAPTMAR